MRILGIETSCDDTSAAVVDAGSVLSNVTSSQDALHAEFGGVVPELAARRHLETIDYVVRLALERAECSLDDLDALAVTRGPGLIGSLLVGLATAQGLALRTGLPVIGVNHLEGHVLSPLIDAALEPPFLSLLVSGGHSALYLVSAVGSYEELASTRDDSAGEAFDKAAKMLGLGYPGGKVVDEKAREGNARALALPRGRVKADRMALSFSGLKTALWQTLETDQATSTEDVCASFQEAVVDVLIDRVRRAVEATGVRKVSVAGGVSANSRLRARITELAEELDMQAEVPPMRYCTDNAAMIAFAAWLRHCAGLEGEPLQATARLPLGPRRRLS